MYPCPPSETLGTPSTGVNIFKNSAGSGIEPESRREWTKWKCRQNATSRQKNECSCCVKIKYRWVTVLPREGTLSMQSRIRFHPWNGGNVSLIERVRTALKRTIQFFHRVLPLHHPACYATSAWEKKRKKRKENGYVKCLLVTQLVSERKREKKEKKRVTSNVCLCWSDRDWCRCGGPDRPPRASERYAHESGTVRQSAMFTVRVILECASSWAR